MLISYNKVAYVNQSEFYIYGNFNNESDWSDANKVLY